MKTAVATSSSVKSCTTTMEERSEPRDSCYFPGCRKDANCNCDMCVASFNATLDLMPASTQRSTLTKFSSSKPVQRTPVSFDSSIMSTPRKSNRKIALSSPFSSTPRFNFEEKAKRRGEERGYWLVLLRLVLGLSLIFLAEFGFPWVVAAILQPQLSPGLVRSVSERSWVQADLSGRLGFLHREFQGLIDGMVSNCSHGNSRWEINQWSDGNFKYLTRKVNSSWAHKKWSSSAVQLDPNTWVLEYRRSSILENSSLLSAALDFLKFRMWREVAKLKQHFWLLSAFEYKNKDFTAEENFIIPT